MTLELQVLQESAALATENQRLFTENGQLAGQVEVLEASQKEAQAKLAALTAAGAEQGTQTPSWLTLHWSEAKPADPLGPEGRRMVAEYQQRAIKAEEAALAAKAQARTQLAAIQKAFEAEVGALTSKQGLERGTLTHAHLHMDLLDGLWICFLNFRRDCSPSKRTDR